MSRYISDDENYSIEIDLKPALDDKEFDLRLQKDFMKYSNKILKTLWTICYQKFIPVMIDLVKIDPDKKLILLQNKRGNGYLIVLNILLLMSKD